MAKKAIKKRALFVPGFLDVCLFGVAFAMGVVVFLHFNPGAMSPDSLNILKQARTGIFEDSQPPLMAAIWVVVNYLIPGPIGMLSLNLALFYGGLFLVFRWGAQRYRYWVVTPLLVAVGMFPPIVGILGVIWVDILMAGFFLAAIGVFLLRSAKGQDGTRVKFLLAALVLAAMGLAVRHNGAAAAFPLIVFFLYKSMREQAAILRRLVLAVVVGGIVTLLFFVGTKQVGALVVDNPKHFWRIAAMYDIVGVSYREKQYLFNADIFSDNSIEDINKLYSPRSFMPLYFGKQIHALPGQPMGRGKPFDALGVDPSLNSSFFSNWVSVITGHPKAYLSHRYDVFVSLVTRSPWGLWAPVYEIIEPNDLGIPERPIPKSAYFDKIRLLAQQSIIFVPLLYLVLSAIAVIPTLIIGLRFQNDAFLLSSALYSSGLAHMAGLFFVAASADFRYSHWLIVTTVLGTSFVLLELLCSIWKFYRRRSVDS